MRFTATQYDEAIKSLQDAKQQLEPDALPCAICSDSGHMAWECGFNPLFAMAMCRDIAAQAESLHETLHLLGGHAFAFGERLGPAKVVMPDAEHADSFTASVEP